MSQTPQAVSPIRSRERGFVLLLCVLAAIHVFVFSAAFPFFNNVDEPIHFDLVLKYSHRHLPRKLEPISADSAAYLALFSSCAYLGTPDEFPGHKMPPPPWTEPVQIMRPQFVADSASWQLQENYEVSEPPLYYAVAGAWWRAGKLLGLNGGQSLYWLRFLNVAQIIALAWLAWLAARLVFPENSFVRIGVPAIVAVMPQTAFYSINNDMPSSLCFGAAFLCLLKWLFSGNRPVFWGAATGLAFAATYLAKTTNLPLLAAAAVFIGIKMYQERNGKPWNRLPDFLAFFGCAALPILAWTVWCKINYGDWTGSKIKMDHLGWTLKAFGDWWHHPIFTAAGLWTYLSGQLGTFWQGEFDWHGRPMALPFSNNLYCVLSLVLPAAILPALLRASAPNSLPRFALWLSLACCLAALAFFALASIIYDFHNCTYPSRARPYFQSGRLFLGALVPFLLCFVYGLDRLLDRFGDKTKYGVLALLIFVMVASEIASDLPVFSNAYNWFHLP